jgi:hypothetical protein
VQRCPACTTVLRSRDRFCAACGARLERPDMRRAAPAAAAPPPAPMPLGPAVAPAAPSDERGLAAALAAVLVLALAALAVTLLIAVSGTQDPAPTLVDAPVVTVP